MICTEVANGGGGIRKTFVARPEMELL